MEQLVVVILIIIYFWLKNWQIQFKKQSLISPKDSLAQSYVLGGVGVLLVSCGDTFLPVVAL